MRKEAAEEIRTIFNAPDRETADTYLKKAVEKYAIIAPTCIRRRQGVSV